MCDILRASFLNNHEAMICGKEVSKSQATKMLRISLQIAEEVFPALKQSSVSVLHRQSIYQLVFFCLHYPVYSQSVTYTQLALRFMQIFSLSLTYFMHRNIPLFKIMSTRISYNIWDVKLAVIKYV